MAGLVLAERSLVSGAQRHAAAGLQGLFPGQAGVQFKAVPGVVVGAQRKAVARRVAGQRGPRRSAGLRGHAPAGASEQRERRFVFVDHGKGRVDAEIGLPNVLGLAAIGHDQRSVAAFGIAGLPGPAMGGLCGGRDFPLLCHVEAIAAAGGHRNVLALVRAFDDLLRDAGDGAAVFVPPEPGDDAGVQGDGPLVPCGVEAG